MFSLFSVTKKKIDEGEEEEEDVGADKTKKFTFRMWDTEMDKELNKFIPTIDGNNNNKKIDTRDTGYLLAREKTLCKEIHDVYVNTCNDNSKNPLFDNILVQGSSSNVAKYEMLNKKVFHTKIDVMYEKQTISLYSPLDELILIVWSSATVFMIYGISQMKVGNTEGAIKALNKSARRYEWLASVTKTQGLYDYKAWDFLYTRAYMNKGLEFWCRACITACQTEQHSGGDTENEEGDIDFTELVPHVYWTLEFLKTTLLLFKNNTGKDDVGDEIIRQLNNQIYMWEKWYVFCVLGHIDTMVTRRRTLKEKVIVNMNVVIYDVTNAVGPNPSVDHQIMLAKMRAIQNCIVRNAGETMFSETTQKLQTLYVKKVIGEDVYNSDAKITTMLKDRLMKPVKHLASSMFHTNVNPESNTTQDAFSFVHSTKIKSSFFVNNEASASVVNSYPNPTEQGQQTSVRVEKKKMVHAVVDDDDDDETSSDESSDESSDDEPVIIPTEISNLNKKRIEPRITYNEEEEEDEEEDEDYGFSILEAGDDYTYKTPKNIEYSDDEDDEYDDTNSKKNEEIVAKILRNLTSFKKKPPNKTYNVISFSVKTANKKKSK